MEKPLAFIIEDERDILALFRHVMDIAGYQTEIVLNGKDALERLATIRPDIVLLDVQLPGVSGLEILKTIRSDERLVTTPVVLITAHAQYLGALPAEPDLILLKPADILQLSNLVQRLKATHGAMRDRPYETATGLYTYDFFIVRLTFAFERIKQTRAQRFGVLFASIEPFETLKKKLMEREFNRFLHEMAGQFKSTLRPTDTMAWWDEGCFLTLVEEVQRPDMTLKIAQRVRDSLADFFKQKGTGINLQARVGLLICDNNYESVEKIISDIKLARILTCRESTPAPVIYDRKRLSRVGRV